MAAGCQEVITYSLVHPNQADQLDLNAPWPPRERPRSELKTVFNPMSVDQSALRTTLLGSLLETVRSNLRHRERVWCFELARVYLPPFDPLPSEPRRLALAMTGPRQPATWAGAARGGRLLRPEGCARTAPELARRPRCALRVDRAAPVPDRAETAELVVGANGDHRSLGPARSAPPADCRALRPGWADRPAGRAGLRSDQRPRLGRAELDHPAALPRRYSSTWR